jgi:cytochrome c1
VSAARALAALALAAALAACGERGGPGGAAPVQGNAERGRIALTQYACHACHMIPGVTGSEVYVGRPLEGLGERRFIAGNLANNQANLVRWIRNPKEVDPLTAMPVMGVSEADAIDISAYLLTRR